MKKRFLLSVVFLTMLSTCVFAADYPYELQLRYGPQYNVTKILNDGEGGSKPMTLASADVNNDGYMDFLVCDTTIVHSGEIECQGLAYILFGSSELISEESIELNEYHDFGIAISPPDGMVDFGLAACGGDFNGDGFGDFAISAKYDQLGGREDIGAVVVIYGKEFMFEKGDILLRDNPFGVTTIWGKESGDSFGYSLSSGDYNGDGDGDLIVGAINASPKDRPMAGAAYLFFGSDLIDTKRIIDLTEEPSGVLPIYGVEYNINVGSQLGCAIASGDIDNDGYDDFVISAAYADPKGRSDAGEIYCINGSSDIGNRPYLDMDMSLNEYVNIVGETVNYCTGFALSIGDLNGDFYDDVVINASGYGSLIHHTGGISYILEGSNTFFNTPQIDLSLLENDEYQSITGEHRNERLKGCAIGDLNGDNIDDLFQGSTGSGYIVFGDIEFFDAEHYDLSDSPVGVVNIRGTNNASYVGYDAVTGDLDGNGINDAIFSSKNNLNETYIMWGRKGSVNIRTKFVFTAQTGRSATLLFTPEYPPILESGQIEPGDEIGVFTLTDFCAGAGIWTGENLAITVWGDDPYTTVKDGFAVGEKYKFKIYDKSKDLVYDLSCNFFDEKDAFLIDGFSVVSSSGIKVITYTLELEEGWNTFSLPVMPNNLVIEELFAPIAEHIVYFKDSIGSVWWPEYGINTLKDWEYTNGYKIYVDEAVSIEVLGYVWSPLSMPYSLAKGWNLISYTGEDGLAPKDAFASLGNTILLVKDREGKHWWQKYYINELKTLEHGKGYWIYMKQPATLTFPDYELSPTEKTVADATPVSRYFQIPPVTGSDATLLIPVETVQSLPVSKGDEIGVFTTDGFCAGASVWNGGNLVVTVRGDNPMTDAVDGMRAGETYTVILHDRETARDIRCTMRVSEGGIYCDNGITIASLLTPDGTAVAEEAPATFSLSQNSPNPFNPTTSIPFTLPKEGRVAMTVFDITGRRVATLADGVYAAGAHEVMWDASQMASGVYICRLETAGKVKTVKMTLAK